MIGVLTKSKQEELAELFQKLNDEDQTFVLNFVEFLLSKKLDTAQLHNELRQELLERKQKALLDLEQGKVISEEELYLEMEGLAGK